MLDTILLISVITIIFYYFFIRDKQRERRNMRQILHELKDNNKETEVTVIERPFPYLIPFDRLYRWYYDQPYYYNSYFYDPFFYHNSGSTNASIVRHSKRKPIYSKPKPKSISKSISKSKERPKK
jgi:hypothetical protein